MSGSNPMCPKCYSWKETTKAGISRGKQRYKCGNCGTHYTTNNKYVSSGKGKHYDSFHFKVVICHIYERMKLEGKGLRQSVREIKSTYQPYLTTNLTHSTILYWMKKYEDYKKTGKEF